MSTTVQPKPVTAGLQLFELAAADPEVRFSPHCWKIRMALAHKGLEADRVPWRFTDKADIEFTGQGSVPVLVDNGKTVCDSWQIALHLEESYPERPSLFGSPDALPLCRFVNAWADGMLLGAIARVIAVDIHRYVHEKDKAYFRTTREKRFRAGLEEVCADTAARLAEFRAALAPMRGVLGTQSYLCGAAPAYADYCVFGMFMWSRCISATELLAADDVLVPWRERLLDAFGGLGRRAPVVAPYTEGPVPSRADRDRTESFGA